MDELFTGKAIGAIEMRNGDLLLKGWAARYTVDMEDEAFAPGAFTKSIANYLNQHGPILYNHKPDIVLGRATDMREVAGEGLWLEALITRPPGSSPHFWIFDSIKRGVMRGLSVGGVFKRRGDKIERASIFETSITAVPVGQDTGFEVVPYEEAALAGAKAALMADFLSAAEAQVARIERRLDLAAMQLSVAGIPMRVRAQRARRM